jgi:Flp pilus assembly protein TadG
MKHVRKSELGMLSNEDGVTLVIIALLIVMFVAFTAMAVDIAHLYVVRNELHNAADSGALAGARCLYDCMGSGVTPGSTVNQYANQFAFNAATANNSEKLTVDVNWNPGDNIGSDIERGHWSFATRTFTPKDVLTPPVLWNVDDSVLDGDENFVNAVRVRARREQTQAASFFARILGFTGFNVSAEAVAYIGFAGKLNPEEVDQPIAVCRQSIVDAADNYTCNTGRMSNSGSNAETHNTSAWTNFSQPCDTASSSSVRPLVCAEGNPRPLIFGIGAGTTGGEEATSHKDLRDCFGPATRTTPWNMTLPVIDCPGNNPSNCATVLGAVNVDIVWISDNDASGDESKLATEDFPPSSMGPTVFGTWTCPSGYTRVQCWDNFVQFFHLKNVDGIDATYARRSIYFLPSCDVHEPTGLSGGQNYGILAKIPVLVH